jgi:signal transduction histidine kinase
VEESQRILKMLETLMDISQAETGVMRLELEVTDVAALVEDMAELYRYAAEEKGIHLKTEIRGPLPSDIDANRIRQVFSNLLDNAVKYTPEGGEISVSAAGGDDSVEVTVRDTGVGIQQTDLDHIWDRLYRSDRSRSQPGLGLGLSLVRAIITAHGGSISVTSEPGRGSCFIFRLPRGSNRHL